MSSPSMCCGCGAQAAEGDAYCTTCGQALAAGLDSRHAVEQLLSRAVPGLPGRVAGASGHSASSANTEKREKSTSLLGSVFGAFRRK